MQQVLPLPKTNEGEIYYSRQLNNFNLSVFGFHDNVGQNFLWNETIARRCSNEISSCILKYLKNLSQSGKVNSVELLSDSCGGQNRNRFFMGMIWWAAQQINNQEIHHIFFVRGHSEQETDSIHGRIERASKYVEVYETTQWATVIRGAKRKPPMYVVTEMVSEDFLNFKNLCNTFINMSKTTSREVVKYMNIRRYSVRKGDPCINIQYSMNAPIKRMNVFDTGRRSTEIIDDVQPEQLYKERLGLNITKKKDLLSLCAKI